MSVLGHCINNDMPMILRVFRCENIPDRQKKNRDRERQTERREKNYSIIIYSHILRANYKCARRTNC